MGSSHAVRIPQTLLEQAGLTGDVEIRFEGSQLIIQPARVSRPGWDVQFSTGAENGGEPLADEALSTHWDEDDWT